MSRALAAVLVLVAAVAPASAQTPPSFQTTAAPPQPGRVEFFSNFDFRLGLEHLVSDDIRFVWDADFGGDVDLIDYGVGRLTFVANYRAILGSEYQPFDPNQGDYLLEGSLSARTSALEVAGVFHHLSRHLGDRPKRVPIDWNMIGGRVRGAALKGRAELDGRLDVRGVVQRSSVDYRWEVDGEARARVHLRPRIGAIASGSARVIGVDGSRARGTQYAWRGEGGVRLDGRGAALELFVAAERRIDPYQLEFSTETWLTAGFRVASR